MDFVLIISLWFNKKGAKRTAVAHKMKPTQSKRDIMTLERGRNEVSNITRMGGHSV